MKHAKTRIRPQHTWVDITGLAVLPMVFVCLLYVGRLQAFYLVSAYGAVALGRVIFQAYSAHIVLTRNASKTLVTFPYASIILPVCNEDGDAFDAAVKSLSLQNYPANRLHLIVVDDGSDNADELESVAAFYGAEYHLIRHGGKREAMYHAFQVMPTETEAVLTADSDTVWDANAAYELVAKLTTSPSTGAVTGYVGASNYATNLLTRLIGLRYWMAFNQERASQGAFGVVTCVSGPLGAYRRHLIDEIADEFRNQTFRGKACTFGDDRHLTNLVLGRGYRVRYAAAAVAFTNVPESLKTYIKQQARWGRSYWREQLWTFKALRYQSLYLTYEWGLSFILPILLLATMGRYFVLAVMTGAVHYLGLLLTLMVGMSVVRTLEPIRRTRDAGFLLFAVYTVLHLFVLLPLRFYSLATMTASKWGSRSSADTETERVKPQTVPLAQILEGGRGTGEDERRTAGVGV